VVVSVWQARFPDSRLERARFTAFPIFDKISDHFSWKLRNRRLQWREPCGSFTHFPCIPLGTPATVNPNLVMRVDSDLFLFPKSCC